MTRGRIAMPVFLIYGVVLGAALAIAAPTDFSVELPAYGHDRIYITVFGGS